MKARHTLFAAGSTVTLVAGGIFLSAAPASANHNSQECLTAKSEFTSALHTVELNAELKVQLTDALQGLVNAQAALDLVDVEGAATLGELELLVTDAVAKIKTEQLPNINAIINANPNADSAVGEAQLLLEAALGGPIDPVTADALLELGIDVEDFLLAAALDIDGLTAAVNAAVTTGDLTAAQATVLLGDLADGELTQTSIDALVDVEIVVDEYLLEAGLDLAGLEEAIVKVIVGLELEAEKVATARALVALFESNDLSAILDAEVQLEALLGVDLDLSALADLELQVAAALAILDAQADLDAAIAVVNGLQVQLDALDINLLEVEALFDAAIEACGGAGAGAGVGGGNNNDDAPNYGNGAGGTGGAVTTGGNNGGAGGTGGTNRGMNVQTAASTASTDPAGIGALAAGLGFVVAAGTLAARRVRHS